MAETEVILAIEPRLLREFLQRAIAKEPSLRVVIESEGLERLPSLPESSRTGWLVVSLAANATLPLSLDLLLSRQPDLCVVGVADDGSQARIRRPGSLDVEITGLSLARLVAILQSRGPQITVQQPTHSMNQGGKIRCPR